MARHLGKQGEWPRVTGNPTSFTLAPDGYQKSDRDVAGPLRMGTAPGVGPKGVVIADYERDSDFGTDMIARDRKIDRKFPSDLISRELRRDVNSADNNSTGKRMPK